MKIVAMSDLHLNKKTRQAENALRLGADAELVLLAGDLVNDGTPEQLERMHQCIAGALPDVPVLAVAGNHDYPHQPSPMIRVGLWDYPAMQDWLLSRQPYPYVQDGSGAYSVRVGDLEIIGLNCVSHWRRFKFPNGDQLKWLARHLDESDARWRIIMCHGPLLAHNPKRSDTKPYLSRDEQLQQILDVHRNIIFLSGHTHISMDSPGGCVEYEKGRNHLYINDGSIRPTTRLTAAGLPEAEPADGNVVELVLEDTGITVTAVSVKTGQQLWRGRYETV